MSKRLLFMGGGAVLGYAYYALIGCTNGCAITGSPVNSAAYGALIAIVWSWPGKKNKGKKIF